MTDSQQDPNPESLDEGNSKRCLVCDSVLQLTADGRCLMCGAEVELIEEEPVTSEESKNELANQIEEEPVVGDDDIGEGREPSPKLDQEPDEPIDLSPEISVGLGDAEELESVPVVESVLRERQSRLTIVMAAGVFFAVFLQYG